MRGWTDCEAVWVVHEPKPTHVMGVRVCLHDAVASSPVPPIAKSPPTATIPALWTREMDID